MATRARARAGAAVLLGAAVLVVVCPPCPGRAAGVVVTPEQHGAVGDGKHNDTAAVRAAALACAAQGEAGCTLRLSREYLTAPFQIPSHCDLLLEGTIVACPRDWWCGPKPEAACFGASAYLSVAPPPAGREPENITVRGGGRIVGQGAAWWAAVHDDLAFRPHLALFRGVRGLTVRDVTLVDSPNHNILSEDTVGLRVLNVTVLAPHDSKNTDGLNVGGGRDSLVEGCHISNGDDCVSIVPGATPPPPGLPALPYGGNVVVRNMTCVGGHGISIGSIREGMVENVTVEDVFFDGGENGARIKTYPNGSGFVRDVAYRRIRLERVGKPINVNGFYCPPSQKPYPCPPSSRAVNISGLVFDGFSGTAAGPLAGQFVCSAAGPCTDIAVSNVHLTAPLGLPAHFHCDHASGRASNCTPPSCLAAVA